MRVHVYSDHETCVTWLNVLSKCVNWATALSRLSNSEHLSENTEYFFIFHEKTYVRKRVSEILFYSVLSNVLGYVNKAVPNEG